MDFVDEEDRVLLFREPIEDLRLTDTVPATAGRGAKSAGGLNAAAPNDSMFGISYWLYQASRKDIHALEAWDVTPGDSSAIVAVVDTGVLRYHPDLGGMGQWSQGGMVMVGDMFNNALKARVDALCAELAGLLRAAGLFSPAVASRQSQSQSHGQPGGVGVSLFVDTPLAPLRFNYAVPIQKESYDVVERFRFTIQTRF